MKIKIEAEVYPTESREKVMQAVKNLFPIIDLHVQAQEDTEVIVGEGAGLESLENLKNMLRSRKIRAAARSILRQSKLNGKLVFYMNKQAAYARQASFTEPFTESPLPPIRVEIESDDVDKVIEWLTE
ncbi:MAG: hypothetical protein LZ172_00005 [Thaumarchaeota archaeon]|jgi:uncharacterized protein|nr:hypothetical protein [Candidatus Geocrenenecus arthurdayi]MCL7390054.1 hypothetical protein [Candidatus Geocrenenecus arthurdayi]MCL7390492.1 hypothetical protein [Candidatus Geocrenenecus arthurdayi]MCL7395941.1 hypothetical protein [Candidatus Geocrenenecus arthurdayi]MCL7402723.1 hypothetical protein [Candidatus Geocrenenecus arthurdayi]